MKKNVLMITLFTFIVLFILGFVIYRSDLLPEVGSDFSEKLQEEQVKGPKETNRSVRIIQENEVLENEDFEFTVLASTISKKINNLNHVNPKYYVLSDVKVDTENTLLDDHSYLEVELLITNLKDINHTISLSNISLFTEQENELINVTDISLTNTVKDTKKKDRFKLEFKPNEERKIYLGYIVTDEQYQTLKDRIFILPDLNGVSTMDPHLLTKVKLEIKEN